MDSKLVADFTELATVTIHFVHSGLGTPLLYSNFPSINNACMFITCVHAYIHTDTKHDYFTLNCCVCDFLWCMLLILCASKGPVQIVISYRKGTKF